MKLFNKIIISCFEKENNLDKVSISVKKYFIKNDHIISFFVLTFLKM